MKSQALQRVHEWDEAIDTSRRCLRGRPLWAGGYQTLGRAFLGAGRVREARTAFARGLHLSPEDQELREEDLKWAQHLYT